MCGVRRVLATPVGQPAVAGDAAVDGAGVDAALLDESDDDVLVVDSPADVLGAVLDALLGDTLDDDPRLSVL